MQRHNTRAVSAAFLLFVATAASAQPGAAPPPPGPPSPEAQAHIDTARTIAADDLKVPFDFFCVPGNARPNNFSAPPLTPVKLFDNLYAVGNSESVVYAITTSDGIVLLDSGHPGDIETIVLPGLVALGLDPADIKYVLLGHGHNDHYGGAAFLQQQGARIGTTEADWATIAAERPSQLFGEIAKPTQDFVVHEGEPIVVGDTTITPVEIPGHTPGSLAFIFPVRDGATTHVAGLFGGTVLSTGFVQVPALRNYIASIAHYRDIARQMNVDVEIQNHPIFDDTPARIAALGTRAAGAAHPFVMGNERYLRFWDVVSECMQASLIQREATQ
jgi:metallo-beta-lactamase class B